MSKPIDQNMVKKVHEAIKANKGKATLKELSEKTNLPYRVVHNITWRMEGAPKGGVLTHREEATIQRVNTGRTVEYGRIPRGVPVKDLTPIMAKVGENERKYATMGSVEA